MSAFLQKIFGSRNERLISQLGKKVVKINQLEKSMQDLSAEGLINKTQELKSRVQAGENLDSVLPEAFALVREASSRVLGMRHFDVQLIGGMVLHQGKIAEMRTGEGKTLVATLPAFLNALTGNGVHVITVNDYLVQRDAAEMGKLFSALGLSTGIIINNLSPEERKKAYSCDITYGTNNEFGFDYLRDNMTFSKDQQVQRKLNYAIIDEVDSILIDEARTPLVISGPAEDSSELYKALTLLVKKLKPREGETGPGDYYLDEKSKQAFLTEDGHHHMENLLAEAGLLSPGESLYAAENVSKMHYISAVLRANFLYALDTHYMIKNGEVLIVDEHTGRAMQGRRWSDGLHQAIEAKEGVKIQNENQTLASITFQNFFRQYTKISGMTGTADTEAYEFHQIYGLEVIVIPTNKPMVRLDYPDVVYLTEQEKFEAIVKEIEVCHARQQPVLVGTTSIENSEKLAHLLNQKNIPHDVLNAKQHEREAHIIAQAGRPGAVTIATNMAGRGTDIMLGGNYKAEIENKKIELNLENLEPELIKKIKQEWMAQHQQVLQAGGLYILGTERHESRRVDNQLRGRAGRQGDPGVSRFYLSLEDHLLRIFAGPWVKTLMSRIGMGRGEAIESRMVSNQIAKAQKRVENHHFDIRKALLEFDNVANDQRQVIYKERQILIDSQDMTETIEAMRDKVAESLIFQHMPPHTLEAQWDIPGLERALLGDFGLSIPIREWLDQDQTLTEQEVLPRVLNLLQENYKNKKSKLDLVSINQLEKTIVLQILDNYWREHLGQMDHLRHSVNLRGYAMKDPKQEYKRESFNLFSKMLERFRYEVIGTLSKLQINPVNNPVNNPPNNSATNPTPENRVTLQKPREDNQKHMGVMNFQQASLTHLGTQVDLPLRDSAVIKPNEAHLAQEKIISRNEPCPCGSGEKFKHCHGKLE